MNTENETGLVNITINKTCVFEDVTDFQLNITRMTCSQYLQRVEKHLKFLM